MPRGAVPYFTWSLSSDVRFLVPCAMKAFVSNINLVSAVCSTKIRDIMHDISLHENRILWIVNEEQNEGKKQ